MTVLLDASEHPPSERADLVHEVIASSGALRRVELRAPLHSVHLRAEAWTVGRTQILRTAGTPMTLTRTARDVRAEAPEMLAVAVTEGGALYDAGDVVQKVGPGGMALIDFSAPYVFSHAGPRTGSLTVHIPNADLGLDVDVVRAAIPRLGSSEVLPLLRGHLLQMSSALDDVAATAIAAQNLGAATTALVRALVVSAAGGRARHEVLHETMRARVMAYLRAHLHERDLTPARVAAAHHVSLRTLYTLWGQDDGGLVDWIVRERLHHISEELATRPPESNIFTIARRWGFSDPSHFSRRFRATYGVSPREWLRHANDTWARDTRPCRPGW